MTYAKPRDSVVHELWVPVMLKHFELPRNNKIDHFSHLPEITKSDSEIRHVCLSVRLCLRMEQLGSHWTDFHEIWYLIVYRIRLENYSFIKIWQE